MKRHVPSDPDQNLVKFLFHVVERPTPVAHTAFFFPGHLSKCFLERRVEENGVITESVSTGGAFNDQALSARFIGERRS
jgi:hypothetical protein